MKNFLIALILLVGTWVLAQEVVGLVVVESQNTFDITLSKLTKAIADSPLTLITTINHKENAEKAELDLRPTTLFIFGNPQVGTPLIQMAPTLAIDLPQKILVWQADDDKVYLAYNSPEYLKTRHSLENSEEALAKIAEALSSLVNAASQ